MFEGYPTEGNGWTWELTGKGRVTLGFSVSGLGRLVGWWCLSFRCVM